MGAEVLQERVVVVAPPATIEVATADALDAELVTVCRSRPARVIVDFGGVVFLDSSAVLVTLAALARVQDAGCTVVVRNPSRFLCRVARLLVMTSAAADAWTALPGDGPQGR